MEPKPKERIVFDEDLYYGDEGEEMAINDLMERDGLTEDEVREEAIRRADALMADYPAVLSRLKEKSAAMTRAAGENERLLLEMLEEHRKH